MNTAIDDCSIKHLKAVVLDELHMIDDDHRGYLMELMGTKLLTLPQPVQIIGMSATMSVSTRVQDFPGGIFYLTATCRISSFWQLGSALILMRPATDQYRLKSTLSMRATSTRQPRPVSCSKRPTS